MALLRPSADQPPRPAWSASLRGLLRDALSLAQVRLELLALEGRSHAQAVVGLLLLGWAALCLLLLGLAFLAVLLTVLWWDTPYRVLALAAFAFVFLTLGVVAAAWAWRSWQAERLWFEASRQELAQDLRRLRP
ncbi:MAG: phage holin family protein [Pseudomonadota bacterium]|jgi:uncharacterized membrane protein YqjE